MEYNFREIEQRWQQQWIADHTYRCTEDPTRKKFYVLNMFPYPSGAGLHVGHPLGYIASDIYARYKRQQGFNVLNPMGYDAYGLPAEQYAIQTGQHPAITTEANIRRYREQLDKIGFSFDWEREVRTCDPDYYHWTQWAFSRMFNSYYDNHLQKAQPISLLISHFEAEGTSGIDVAQTEPLEFTAEEWRQMSDKEKQQTLMNYRLAYLGETMVNWCQELGTVLANDEVVEGVSVRGGFPVVQKKMRQWCLRVSAYAQRLLDGLDTIQWSDSIKETQRNWIGRSEGAEVVFRVKAPSNSPRGGEPELETIDSDIESKWEQFKTAHPAVYAILRDNAKENRKNQTPAETALWEYLRGNALGYKFRRQHVIGDVIADFACLAVQLVIEVDGGYHLDPKQQEYDRCRTLFLNELGFEVMRFTNEEVMGDIDNVVARIKQYIDAHKDSEKKSQIAVGNQKVSPTGGDLEGAFTIFTTRADTMFGVTFMVLAPESELVAQLTTEEQRSSVEEYLAYVKKRTELDRISDRKVTGVFSGSYAINPLTGDEVPIWISEYVLAGYGTGAIMAVPAHDSRDYAFARHFNLPIIPLIEGADVSEESYDAKEGIVCNSPRVAPADYDGLCLNGLSVKEAISRTKQYVEEKGLGRVKVNYRLRDAIFSRQRYWGEPFPVYYKDGMPQMIPDECLPLELPDIPEYRPTETGEPPLGRATLWAWDEKKQKVVDKALIDDKTVFPIELNTMPGFAGSSAYYLRYMDPHNPQALVSESADKYWQAVDLYVGGSEHATGHLIYSRFWNKFLFDLGVSCKEEPFQKLVNQGMIQGRSNFVYRIKDSNTFVSCGLKKNYDVTPIHVDVNIVHGDVLDTEAFRAWRPEYATAEFILEDGKYVCGWAVEKMSKSMFNVVNPDMIVERYGADTLRLYEMFLGPVEQSKPWDTNGIDGCHRFLKKFWNLAQQADASAPTAENMKSLHKLIKKVSSDIEAFSFNTSVAAFMIAVGELSQQQCHSTEVLRTMAVLIAPFCPHIAEELWHQMGGEGTVCDAQWPSYDEKYLVENEVNLTVSFNGKARYQAQFQADAKPADIEKAVLSDERSARYLEGKTVVKVIVVPKKIVNVVVK